MPTLKPHLDNVKVTIQIVATKHHKRIEHARIFAEMGGCVFVAMETHILAFILLLMAWLMVDIVKLFDREDEFIAPKLLHNSSTNHAHKGVIHRVK